jgi:Fungal trichothecene efflux pump (TRI12)
VYPTQLAVFFTTEATTLKQTAIMSLPPNLGLVFGEILLMVFGTRVGHWKWALTGSVTIMVFFGALLGLGTPERKGMLMAFGFLSQMGFGWAQMMSIAFIQFGVPQVELGISGGLAGVSRFAGGAIAISVYSSICKLFLKIAPRLC